MAHRSYLYVMDGISGRDLRAVEGLLEWPSEIPIVARVLMSADLNGAPSTLWPDPIRSFVAGFDRGLWHLERFFAALPPGVAEPGHISGALEFLRPFRGRGLFLLLETAEITELSVSGDDEAEVRQAVGAHQWDTERRDLMRFTHDIEARAAEIGLEDAESATGGGHWSTILALSPRDGGVTLPGAPSDPGHRPTDIDASWPTTFPEFALEADAAREAGVAPAASDQATSPATPAAAAPEPPVSLGPPHEKLDSPLAAAPGPHQGRPPAGSPAAAPGQASVPSVRDQGSRLSAEGPGHVPRPPVPPRAAHRPAPTGALAWGLGLIVFISLPFVFTVIGSVVMLVVGLRGRRDPGNAGANALKAANWALSYLLGSILLVGGHFTILALATSDGPVSGFYPIGIPLTLWVLLSVMHAIYCIVGMVQTKRWGRVRLAVPRIIR